MIPLALLALSGCPFSFEGPPTDRSGPEETERRWAELVAWTPDGQTLNLEGQLCDGYLPVGGAVPISQTPTDYRFDTCGVGGVPYPDPTGPAWQRLLPGETFTVTIDGRPPVDLVAWPTTVPAPSPGTGISFTLIHAGTTYTSGAADLPAAFDVTAPLPDATISAGEPFEAGWAPTSPDPMAFALAWEPSYVASASSFDSDEGTWSTAITNGATVAAHARFQAFRQSLSSDDTTVVAAIQERDVAFTLVP